MNLPKKLECFEIKKDHLKIINFMLEHPTFPWQSSFHKEDIISVTELSTLLNKNPFDIIDPRHKDLSHFSKSLIDELLSIAQDMRIVMEILKDNLSKGITCGIFIRSEETKNKWTQTTKDTTYY